MRQSGLSGTWPSIGAPAPRSVVETPAIRDRDDGFPLLAHAAEEAHKVLQRVERLLFAARRKSSPVRCPGRPPSPRPVAEYRVAAGVEVLDRVGEVRSIALAPPVARQHPSMVVVRRANVMSPGICGVMTAINRS